MAETKDQRVVIGLKSGPLRPSFCDAPDDLRLGFNHFPDYMAQALTRTAS